MFVSSHILVVYIYEFELENVTQIKDLLLVMQRKFKSKKSEITLALSRMEMGWGRIFVPRHLETQKLDIFLEQILFSLHYFCFLLSLPSFISLGFIIGA